MSAVRLAIAFVICAGVFGCAHQGPLVPPRPVDDQLLAVVPAGIEALIDVDLTQLQEWPSGSALWQRAPEELRDAWGFLGAGVARVDRALIALGGLSTGNATRLVVITGRVDVEALRKEDLSITEAEHRGVRVFEGKDRALAQLGDDRWVSGDPVDVRRAIDVQSGQQEGAIGAVQDRRVVDALGRAPRAKVGRPAIVASVYIDSALRRRLDRELSLKTEADWVAVSFAVGDGFDVGLVAGFAQASETERARDYVKGKIARWSNSPALRMLGVDRFLDPIVVVARALELHGAWRLSAARVEALISTLDRVRTMRGERADVGR
jgi:hypothetical protein